MSAQPACFHRLDEILALLWGFDIGYLDRQAPSDGDTRCGGALTTTTWIPVTAPDGKMPNE